MLTVMSLPTRFNWIRRINCDVDEDQLKLAATSSVYHKSRQFEIEVNWLP